MTVKDIEEFVAASDPKARHYFFGKREDNFTMWMEVEKIGPSADNNYIPGWRFTIDRFTKQEYDPVAKALEESLDESDYISYTYEVATYPKSGYIHHHFECEGF